VVHFALDEHFIFGLEGKPLAQLICEDLGLYPSEELPENDEANLKKIESYITLKVKAPSCRWPNCAKHRLPSFATDHSSGVFDCLLLISDDIGSQCMYTYCVGQS